MQNHLYLPKFAIGDYVAIDLTGTTFVAKIVGVGPRFNEVAGIPTYYLEPPLLVGGRDQMICQILDAAFRRATEEEILLFYRGEYDDQS